MAKATFELPGGTKVTIDGSPGEVAALLDRFGASGSREAPKRRAAGRRKTSRERQPAKPSRMGPTEYIRQLKTENFFRTKRTIAEVREKLEEGAHIYPVTALSAPLYRLVKKRELRRIKEGGTWKYVNP